MESAQNEQKELFKYRCLYSAEELCDVRTTSRVVLRFNMKGRQLLADVAAWAWDEVEGSRSALEHPALGLEVYEDMTSSQRPALANVSNQFSNMQHRPVSFSNSTFSPVSLSEQQRSRPPSREDLEEEEGGRREDAPLVALAPDVSLPEEQPSANVSDSPAFHCLNELLSLGKISRIKAAKLKASYKLLHDTLKSTQDSEIQLLREAKTCRAELEKLQAEVARTEEQSTSEQPESEVNKLRQELLQAYNELKAAEDREYKTQHRLKCLWEEKHYLEKENETQPKPAKLENRTKFLHEMCGDLKKEVTQKRLEVGRLTEDVEAHEMQILKEQKELEQQKEIIKLKEAEKAQLISIPDQILKKTERKKSNRDAAMKKIEAQCMEISEVKQQVKEVEERNHSLRMKREEAIKDVEVLRAQVEVSQKEVRQLVKEQEVNREQEAELTGNRGILEMKLKNIMFDRKHLYESQCIQLREKNRQMQALKRMEHALTMATEQLDFTQSVYNELQAKLDAVPKREASIQQRMELQKEVDSLKVSFEKQKLASEKESQKKQQFGIIQELLKESDRLRKELHNLRCLTQIKVEERGKKHRELLRAEQMNQHIQHELREKDLIIMDHNKLNTTLQCRISQYSKLCNMIMEEKNKYVKLKQITSQTITELMEQDKVLENEMEIQRTILINKDRSLTKSRMKLSNSSRMKEKLHNDVCQVAWQHRQISQLYDDNKLELMKLSQMIDLQEKALIELNKGHETATQRRSFLGIQLLEHEEVLFNYHEKVKIQEAAIAKGNVALEQLEKEINDLQLAINEEKRQIDVKKKQLPIKRKLEGEVTMLQIELSEARDKTFEGLDRTVDYRELKGKDPSTLQLVKKIEQLEVNLAERERQLLEKELLLDQVTRLLKPLSEEAENCQQDRLCLAKKLNQVRIDINDTNQRLMAVSAELSVKQAVALSQQQEIKEKELQMDRCQRRLEEGRPPCPEIEEEWRRMLRDKKRRQRDKEDRERLAEEDEWNQLPNGQYTTAETRPNAYMPLSDSLPLAKPYGAQAPFKPSQPGTNMRHIRKPSLKALEL